MGVLHELKGVGSDLSIQVQLKNQEGMDAGIKMLTVLEAVRKRPGMYIGDTSDGSGLCHMIYEVVGNAIDEVWAGQCTSILVTLYPDGSVSVSDNGCGMPVGIDMDDRHSPKRSHAEIILSELYARPFSPHRGKPGGLHGVGVFVVNALSEWLRLTVRRDGKVYGMEFRRGKPVQRNVEMVDGVQVAPLAVLGVTATAEHGTEIRFLADKEIFDERDFDVDKLAERFGELSYLNKGVEISLADLRFGKKTSVFAHDMGVFVANGKPVHPNVFHVCDAVRTEGLDGLGMQEIRVEAAMQWHGNDSAQIRCYTNGVRQSEGGTHLRALRTAVLLAVVAYRRQKGTDAPRKTYYTRDRVCRGLNCVLSIHMDDPRYCGATKDRLCSPEVGPAVNKVIIAAFGRFLEQNPDDARAICNGIMAASSISKALRRPVAH